MMKSYLWAFVIQIKLWLWLRRHSIEEFERQLELMGCTFVYSGKAKVWTLPRKGKIITDEESVEIIPYGAQ